MEKSSIKCQLSWFIIFVSLLLIFKASCSRHIYPESSFGNINNRLESEKLKAFLESGIEKGMNTQSTSSIDIINTALEYMGVPHCMGGKTKKCMDCSGLLVTVFARHHIHLPHNSEEQARYGKILTGIDELKEGDLVFFIRSYRTTRFITHSGIYTGDNRFIHASSSAGVIITSIYDPWWNERFIFGTRLLE